MIQKLRISLLCLGSALVLYGAIMLFFLGNTIYELCTHPERVELVNYILKNIKTSGPAVHATAANGQEMYVEFSETAKALGYFLLGVMALGVMSGVVRALIWGGVEIIKATLAPWRQPAQKKPLPQVNQG